MALLYLLLKSTRDIFGALVLKFLMIFHLKLHAVIMYDSFSVIFLPVSLAFTSANYVSLFVSTDIRILLLATMKYVFKNCTKLLNIFIILSLLFKFYFHLVLFLYFSISQHQLIISSSVYGSL